MTTDSVVGTATIHFNGAPGTIAVQWGDGATSSRDPADPINSTRPGAQNDPPGTASFKHLYAAPADGSPFTVAITAQVGGESQTIAIGVTPRYRVTQYAALFPPLIHCDSIFELNTEWRIERSAVDFTDDRSWSGLVPDQSWEFDRQTSFGYGADYPLPEFQPLPGSQVSLELTAAETPAIFYDVVEVDPTFDQGLDGFTISLNPMLGSRSFSQVADAVFDGLLNPGPCEAELRADIDVRLLTLGLGGAPVLGQQTRPGHDVPRRVVEGRLARGIGGGCD